MNKGVVYMNTIDIEKTIANVKATLAVEKLQISEKSEKITRKYLEGKITSEQAVMAIKLIYI